MRYERVLAEIYRKPWAILPERFAQICEIVNLRVSGLKLTKQEIQGRLAPHLTAIEARKSATENYGGAAGLIGIYGVISHRMSYFSDISGGTSVLGLTAKFRAAMNDPGVKAVVFDVDSPGGSVEGVPELAEEIYRARGKKKIVAVVNPLSASAAYWLACSAEELVVTPSGAVGSIGVFAAHEDYSAYMEKAGVKVSLISAGKYKTEGNPYEPLSPEARAAIQEDVNSFYEMFVKAVARGRGVAQAAVREGFGEGRLVLAADAIKQKMADRVATLDETIARLTPGAAPKRIMAPANAQASAADDLFPDDDENSDDRECTCACDACMAGNCAACTNAECSADMCEDCPMQEKSRAAASADLGRRRLEVDLHSRNL